MTYDERPENQPIVTPAPAARVETVAPNPNAARYDTVRSLPANRLAAKFSTEDMYAFAGVAVMILGPLLMAATRH